MTEHKKKRIPGISENIKNILHYNDEIKQIYDNMQIYKDKLQNEINIQKERSGKNHLFETKNIINNEIQIIYESRNALKKEKDEIFQELTNLRNSMKGQKKTMTLHEIMQKEKEINEEIISQKMNSQQEKESINLLLELKKKKNFIGNEKDNEKKYFNLEKDYAKVKENLEKVNSELNLRKKEFEDLKIEIENLKEKEKEKTDAMKIYEKKLEELKNIKNEIVEKKRLENEEIKKKEIEHEKFLEEQEKVKNEQQKIYEQKMKIKKLNENLLNLEIEKNNFDPKKFDCLIDFLKGMKDFKNIPIGVVLKLNSENLKIPTKNDEVKNIIQILEGKKNKITEEIEENLLNLNSKIKKVHSKIEQEKKKL